RKIAGLRPLQRSKAPSRMLLAYQWKEQSRPSRNSASGRRTFSPNSNPKGTSGLPLAAKPKACKLRGPVLGWRRKTKYRSPARCEPQACSRFFLPRFFSPKESACFFKNAREHALQFVKQMPDGWALFHKNFLRSPIRQPVHPAGTRVDEEEGNAEQE